MAQATDTNTRVQDQIDELLAQVNAAQAPVLAGFAASQARRSGRLAEAAKRLAADLGEQHAQVTALAAAAAVAGKAQAILQTRSVRESRRPRIRPNEWLVYGNVTDARGGAAVGMRVRVFDRDRKYDDLLGETRTDDLGDFAVVFHERDFLEPGESLAELYVMVSDDEGRLWYTSRDAVRFNSGEAEYFEIRLGEKPAAETPRPSKGQAATKARRKPK